MAGPQRKAAFIEPAGGAHLAWLGSRVRYLAVGEQTAGRYAASVAVTPPGEAFPAHVRHRDHEGLYVLSGELEVAAGNRTLTVPPGGFLNATPGVARRISAAGGEPAEVISIAGPAGTDEFHFRAGLPLVGPDEPVPPVSREDRTAAASIAAGYGLDLSPPAAAFAAEPRLRLTLPGEGKRIAVAGVLCRFLATSEDTDGRYALWEATIPTGTGTPSYSDDASDEAIYVLSGAITIFADGTSNRVGPGGFAHVPSGVPRSVANQAAAEPASILVLVAPAGPERLIEAAGRVLYEPDASPGPPDRIELERLLRTSVEYGIEPHL